MECGAPIEILCVDVRVAGCQSGRDLLPMLALRLARQVQRGATRAVGHAQIEPGTSTHLAGEECNGV